MPRSRSFVTHDQEKNQPKGTDLEMTEVMEPADQNVKIATATNEYI